MESLGKIQSRRIFLSGAASGLGTFVLASSFSEAFAARGRSCADVPAGACDAHVHVVGDPSKYPMSAQRDYTPPPATAQSLQRALDSLCFERVIIVTPSIYGIDNRVTTDAIAILGRDRARGIASINRAVPASQLDALKTAGIVGVRYFFGGEGFDVARERKRIRAYFVLAGARGWNLDISAPPDATAALLPDLMTSPAPLVFDYFGWIAGGTEQTGFEALRSLVASGKAYVKLSEPYRLSKSPPDYGDLLPVVRAYIAANPERVLWGSGWPHVDSSAGRGKVAANIAVTDRHLLDLLERWVPDERTRTQILVQNPARLYGFA